jgi:PAS domain S-box-containing protein
MKRIPYLAYTIVLLALYIFLTNLFPEYAARALFSIPILTSLAVGYLGGWRQGVLASLLGLLCASLVIAMGVVPNNDFIFRVISFVIIAGGINYTQYLKDQYDSTAETVNTQNRRIAEMAAIVESSDDAIISKSLEGIVKTWNLGAEKLFGFTAEEIVGKPLLMVFPEGYVKEEEKILGMMRRGERLDHYETIRKHKDGHLIDVSLTVSPVVNKEGKVIGVSTIARDITEQKKYRRELQRSSERYKTFIENAEAAIWLVEYRNPIDINLPIDKQIDLMFSEGYTAEANQKTAEVYGKENILDFIGKSTMMLSPRTSEADEFLKMFIKQNYAVIDLDVTTEKDGISRYGSVTFKGILEDSKLTRAWVVIRDTTQKRLQEQELERGKQRYQAFIENSEEGIARIEFRTPISTSWKQEDQVNAFFKSGYIAEANAATAKIIGMPSVESILNTPIGQIEVKSEGDARFLRLFIENGYSLQDFDSTEKKGDKLYYHSTSMKGIIENGNWVRAWMVRRDVTAQKEYLIERERLLQAAEDAKKSLEVASAEKDRFLANLSHELRTPLVSILGYSAMLLETEPKSEDAKKMITTINKNAKLQVQLIEDLLDLSRIISGKIELKKEFFDVSELAKEAVETFRKQAEDKGLNIEEEYGDCKFYGDRKRLSQVFLNLMSNAVKFTDKGNVGIHVRCSEDFLTLKVVDSGIGIDPKNFPLLFQAFKQVDSSSTRAKQGLGLGLSIVKNLVELHGGEVLVDSKLGEGSEFTVHLPVVQTTVVEKAEEIISTPVSTSFEGVKMLLVEDEPDSAGFIKYLYEQKGAKVNWVDSAKKARNCIEKDKYDLYIFDLSMPEEDGISLIKSVRAKGDVTKSVALTAFADTYYETKALEAGFDMFLKKPSSLKELLSVIKLIR